MQVDVYSTSKFLLQAFVLVWYITCVDPVISNMGQLLADVKAIQYICAGSLILGNPNEPRGRVLPIYVPCQTNNLGS